MYDLPIFAKRTAMIQLLTRKISVDVIPTEQSDEGSLKLLRSLLKEEPFEKERAKMVRVACVGNYFTASQCADMLSLFSFDSNKLEALECLAPRVIDKQARDVILKEFTFVSNRGKLRLC